MKKLFLLSILVSTIFVSCKKEARTTAEPKNSILIYSTSGYAYLNSVSVFVDGVNLGRLKYAGQSPTCTDTGFIKLETTSGTVYKVEIPSTNGTAGKIKYITCLDRNCQIEIINP